MKIICVVPDNTTNYIDTSSQITCYLKPETALTRSDWPFFVPDWSEEIGYETQLVVRINRLGKTIPERFAHRYYDEVTVGVAFTAKDVLLQLQAAGQPWELATGFDGAAYCGQRWLKLSELDTDVQHLTIETSKNDASHVTLQMSDMRPTIDQIIAYVSRFYLLKTGDLIFTGSPVTNGTVKEGDVIQARLQGVEVLTCRCK